MMPEIYKIIWEGRINLCVSGGRINLWMGQIGPWFAWVVVSG